MKKHIIYPFLVLALSAALNLLPIGQAPAQTLTSLGNFHGSFDSPGFLGNTLYASLHGLVLSGNSFYGTAPGDNETGDSGSVYAVTTDGTGFTNVHSFTYVVAPGYGPRINYDGAFPNAGLLLSGTTLYGTASIGGSSGLGTLFAVSTHGTGFTNLHSFTGGSDGSNPQAALILSGNTLYGTASRGGSSGSGTVFAISTNGTGFTVLHSFNGGSDGSNPQAALILLGNTLYGTTPGSVFAIHTDGTGFTVLTNIGSHGGLILSGNTLYGTAEYGGSSGSGTVFAVRTNGTGYTTLYSFTATYPFDIQPFVTVFTNQDGAFPLAGLTLSGDTLYGTTSQGGSWGTGTLFGLSFQPQLTIARSGTNLTLTWPTNVAGFDYTGYTLQSAGSLVPSAVWSTNSPAPVIVAGRNTVTTPITGAQQLYRLLR